MIGTMRWWLAGILVLAMCVPALARIEPQWAYDEGLKAYKRGDYKRAVEEFTKVVWYDIEERQQNGWPMGPEHFMRGSKAHVYRGVSYLKLGKQAKAEADFHEAAKWGGQSPELRLTIGEAFFRVGRYDESIKVLSELVEANPNMGIAHNYLARSYYMKKDYASSWKHVKEAERLGIPVTALIAKLKKVAPEYGRD